MWLKMKWNRTKLWQIFMHWSRRWMMADTTNKWLAYLVQLIQVNWTSNSRGSITIIAADKRECVAEEYLTLCRGVRIIYSSPLHHFIAFFPQYFAIHFPPFSLFGHTMILWLLNASLHFINSFVSFPFAFVSVFLLFSHQSLLFGFFFLALEWKGGAKKAAKQHKNIHLFNIKFFHNSQQASCST